MEKFFHYQSISDGPTTSTIFDPGDPRSTEFEWEDPDIPFGGTSEHWRQYKSDFQFHVSEFFNKASIFNWTGEEFWLEMCNFFRPDAARIMNRPVLVKVINTFLSRNVNVDFQHFESLAEAYIQSMHYYENTRTGAILSDPRRFH